MDLNRALYALSIFSDTTSGNDTFHQRRVTLIAYKIAEKMGFDGYGLNLILQAGFIHDSGIKTEASKIETFRQIIDENFKQLTKHAIIGARIARFFNLHLDVSNAINLHHTPADNNSSMLGNILFLADNIEVAYRSLSNPFAFNEIYDFIAQKKELFQKDIFSVFKKLSDVESFWYGLNEKNIDKELCSIINKHKEGVKNTDFLKRIAYFMAYISDNTSYFFENYSVIAKNIAAGIGYKLNLNINNLMLSALFSHIGNVFLPVEILNSPGSLNDVDYNIIKSHTYYTKQMLDLLDTPNNIKLPAVYHHETRDSSGYPFKIQIDDINTDVVRAATFLAALLQDRPYRKAYEYDEAKELLKQEDCDKNVLKAALDLDLENILNVKDEYYEGIRRMFI